MDAPPQRVLIFRAGSLGDTVVALPALHVVARAFPTAERRILTNVPRGTREVALQAVLGNSGLVHGYMTFEAGKPTPTGLTRLRRDIRAWRPDVLVYLIEVRPWPFLLRDLLFFRLCGIRRIVGAPVRPELRRYLPAAEGRWEYEAGRLLRRLSALGVETLDRPWLWDMHFEDAERARADAALGAWPGRERFIVFSVGAKVDVKDWGEANWCAVAAGLTRRLPGVGLAIVGAASEKERAARVLAQWQGPTLDLCGALAPRESALVLGKARMFVGHDGGPMHLAAAVGTPCVAVFSARVRPGVWFPYGAQHRVLYHQPPCYDCYLDVCVRNRKVCIASIGVDEVLAACDEVIAALRARERI